MHILNPNPLNPNTLYIALSMRSHRYMRIWQVLDCWTSANVKDYRFRIHDVKVHKETYRYGLSFSNARNWWRPLDSNIALHLFWFGPESVFKNIAQYPSNWNDKDFGRGQNQKCPSIGLNAYQQFNSSICNELPPIHKMKHHQVF